MSVEYQVKHLVIKLILKQNEKIEDLVVDGMAVIQSNDIRVANIIANKFNIEKLNTYALSNKLNHGKKYYFFGVNLCVNNELSDTEVILESDSQ